MKQALALGAVLVLASVSGASYLLLRSERPDGPASSGSSEAALPGSSQAARDAAPEAAGPGELAALRADLRRLSERVSDLEVELGNVRSLAAREAVQPEVAAVETAAAPAQVDTAHITEQIKTALAAEKEREAREVEEQRQERERRQATTRAERIARELSLSNADQTRLADHLVSAQDKRRVMMDSMRDGGFDRDSIRQSMEDFRQWNSTELIRLFGANVASQLEEQDLLGGPGGFGRGGGGRGFGGQGGFGGPGGG